MTAYIRQGIAAQTPEFGRAMPTFNTTLQLAGKTATGIEVPEKIVTALGTSKRPAVRVTVNGHTYRTTIAPMSGSYFIPVSAENREKAGLTAGDKITVVVELDTEKREVAVPDDLAAAMKRNAAARDFFATLSFSHQRAYVDWIESAKKPETRERRVGEAVAMIAQKQKR